MMMKHTMLAIASMSMVAALSCNEKKRHLEVFETEPPHPNKVIEPVAVAPTTISVTVRNAPLTAASAASLRPIAFTKALDAKGIADCSFPSFSLAWSEYASWSAFGVAEMDELVAGAKGKCGPIERDAGVDLEFKFMEYDPSIGAFAAKQVDAVTITNMDMFAAASDQPVVPVFATSTSYGADRLIVPKAITELSALKGLKCRGLVSTVSQYNFEQVLAANGVNPKDYQYSNMDPGAASAAMKTNDAEASCISVWEPFALDVLETRKDVYVLFDSTAIPGEILDLVVVHQEALNRKEGKRFVLAVMETFYRVVASLEDPQGGDTAHQRLGKKVTDLSAEKMRDVLTRTALYRRPEWVASLFAGGQTYPFPEGVTSPPLPKIMDKVLAWAVEKGVTKPDTTVGYGPITSAPNAKFRFDPNYVDSYMGNVGP